MQKEYKIIVEDSSPTVTLKIPTKILKDLVLRAQENGISIEMEFTKRIARSLERNLEMIEQDNATACKAFDKIQSNPELAMQCLAKSKK